MKNGGNYGEMGRKWEKERKCGGNLGGVGKLGEIGGNMENKGKMGEVVGKNGRNEEEKRETWGEMRGK